MAGGALVRRCAHRMLCIRASGGIMEMPLWYWQLCFGVLMIVLMVSHEFD
jgi:hypothetical protein